MIVGIDASRAFLKQRTGIEEYSYQVIKNLRDELSNQRVILYIRKNQKIDFNLPQNWEIKVINFPYLWTQIGLSLEVLFHPADALFIPAHTIPIIHPKNTVVAIHGLEYEFCPQAYSFWERIYMRFSIKNSCRWAKKIIAVSENTKKDLMKLYKVSEEKIKVVYEGYEKSISPFEKGGLKGDFCENVINRNPSPTLPLKKGEISYLLFIGRLEERKNIIGIIEAFEILKEKYKIPHQLILAGKPSHGFKIIKEKIENSPYRTDIFLPGFIKDEEKVSLLKNADVFLFPSFYEGFGLPILEAQAAGVPVVTSNVSSIPEVTICCHPGLDPGSSESFEIKNMPDSRLCRNNIGCSAILVNPNNIEEMAEAVYKIISDENTKKDLIQEGLKNIQRFSWEKCAKEIAQMLVN